MKKYLLILSFILFQIGMVANAQNIPVYVPQNGLVGWWPFNGNTNDESGKQNHCNNYNGNFTSDRNGNSNTAFYGDGNGSGMNISAMNDFPFANSNRTVSVWFKCNMPFPGGDRVLFSYGDNTFGTRFSLTLSSSTLIGIEYMNGAVLANYNADNAWHNLTVTYSGAGSNGVNIYLDGTSLSTIVYSPISSFNTLNTFIHTIGSLNGIYNFAGSYDDIGIWDRALTQQEITDLYKSVSCTPPSAFITPQGNTTFCSGGFVSLYANTGNGYTYKWLLDGSPISNANSSIYSATQDGNYTVEVTDNGCAAVSAAVTVTVNPNPTVNLSNPGNKCINAAPVTLNGSPAGGTYAGAGVTGNSFSPLTAGAGTQTITYSYTNANGCSGTATTNVTVNPLPQVTFIGLNASYTKNDPPSTLVGNPSGGNFTGDGVSGNTFNPSLAANPSSVNVVYVYTDINGCTSATCNSSVITGIISSDNGDADLKARIYPNPSDVNFNLEFNLEKSKQVSIEVIDVMGQIVFSQNKNMSKGSNIIALDLSDQSVGIYFVQLKGKDLNWLGKVIKQ